MDDYYSKRAEEYERIYYRNDPVRQSEQKEIELVMNELFKDKCVLEVACGTGYWTEKISRSAKKILATDNSPEMLEIAKNKKLPPSIRFERDDAYHLNTAVDTYDAGLANFWFSHIPKSRIRDFLQNFHGKLENDSIVFMADNVFVKEIGGELVTKDGGSDTYKIRTLDDGGKYTVIKNYYQSEELQRIFSEVGTGIKIHTGKCFWWISYKST